MNKAQNQLTYKHKKPLVSIVVPVYNGGRYIKKNVTSIINQPLFDRVEVIYVNDGSTDNSQAICEQYTNKYPSHIKLINKSNGGVSSARNRGIDVARGKYIAFLDCDDWWNTGFLDYDISDQLSNNNIDIYGFSYCETNSNCKYIKVHHVHEKTETYKTNNMGRYSHYPHCSFMFSRELLLNHPDIRYPNIKILEDGCFCGRCFFLARSYKTIDKPIFTYWSNSDSTTHLIDATTFFSAIYTGFVSNREWFGLYGQEFNVEKCVCVAFYNYIHMLCYEYGYKNCKSIVDNDDRLQPIYHYKEMGLNEPYYSTIEKWISNSLIFHMKYTITKKPIELIRRVLLKRKGVIRNIVEFVVFRLLKKYEKSEPSLESVG